MTTVGVPGCVVAEDDLERSSAVGEVDDGDEGVVGFPSTGSDGGEVCCWRAGEEEEVGFMQGFCE
jgi:hypothetical protein